MKEVKEVKAQPEVVDDDPLARIPEEKIEELARVLCRIYAARYRRLLAEREDPAA